MTTSRTIIGLVGEPSSGKDTAAAYLVGTHGFIHISTGDLVRAYILENNLGETTRPLLQQVSTKLRQEHGNGYLAELALKETAPKLVVSGLRNLGEVEVVKAAGGKVLALSAPLEQRYRWAVERGRVGDKLTLAEFKRQQAVEEVSQTTGAQQVKAVIAAADHHISNEGTLEQLHHQIDQFLQQIS